MSNFDIFIFLSVGIIGIAVGIYFILLVVMKKQGISTINEGKLGALFKTGNSILNRVNFVWYGIALVIFFGALIFAVVQENYLK